MGRLIGVIATVLAAIAAATGVNFAVSSVSAPDKSVNLENPASPNGANGSSGIINYGTTP